MKEYIYPMLREEAVMYSQMLIKDETANMFLLRHSHRSRVREPTEIPMSSL